MSKWPMKRFGDLFELHRVEISVEPTLKYSQIGVKSFGKGIFRYPTVSGAELGKLRYFRFPPDALMVSNIQAWEGALALSDAVQARECIASNRFFPYLPVDPCVISAEFALWFFLSDPGMHLVRKASPGTTVRNRTVSFPSFKGIEVPVPPLSEQQRVVVWLNQIRDVLEAAKFLGSRSTRADLSARESLLSERHVGPIRVRLGDALKHSRVEVAVDPNEVYRAIGIKSFGKGIIRYPSVKGSEMSKLRFFRFPVDALAVSNIQAWEGAVALTALEDEERVASNRFHFYVPRTGGSIAPEFALAYLLTERGHAQIRAASPGTTIRNKTLSLRRFEDISLPAPDPEVQQRTIMALRTFDRLDVGRNQRQTKANAVLPAALNQVFGSLN